MKSWLLIVLAMISVGTLKPMLGPASKKIQELEAQLEALSADVKEGAIEAKWENLVRKSNAIQPARKEYVWQLYHRTELEFYITQWKKVIELEQANNEIVTLRGQNQGLQKTVAESQKQMEEMVSTIASLEGASKINEGQIKRWKEDALRLGLAKDQYQAEALKYAQQLNTKNQELQQQQLRAKEQEDKLVKETKEILDMATLQGTASAQQIKGLKVNMQTLQNMFDKVTQELSDSLQINMRLQQQLGQTRQKPPTLWALFMNIWRSKKSTAQKGE